MIFPSQPLETVDEVTPLEPPLTHIRPYTGWQRLDLQELWQYRELLATLLWRDVTVRYKQTALGILWAVLQPLLMMGIFTVVMSLVGRGETSGVPYPVFFYSGYLLWYFFSQSISAAAGSVVTAQPLITKIYFPRLTIPLAAIGAPAVDFAFAVVILIGMLIYYGIPLGWEVGLVPVLLLLTALAAVGAGSWLAALNVSYRDFRYTLPFLVQIGMFATPSIYIDMEQVTRQEVRSSQGAAGSLSPHPAGSSDSEEKTSPQKDGRRNERLQRWVGWLYLNPLMGLVETFRASLLGTPIPWGAFSYSAGTSVLLLVCGCSYFRHMERTFADIV